MTKTDPVEPIIDDEITAATPDVPVTPVAEPVIEQAEAATMEERVIQVDRVSRTQKGGRRMRFRALVIIGDRQGNVGMGIGKANEITSAVAKATYRAKRSMITVPIVRHTIPHEIRAKFDSAYVLLKPAAVGTSIIAGSSVRPILELAGVENVVAKCLTRTTNRVNNAYATLKALQMLKDIKTLAPRKYVKAKKGTKVAPVIAAPLAEVTETPMETKPKAASKRTPKAKES